jgi:hypothetical protein
MNKEVSDPRQQSATKADITGLDKKIDDVRTELEGVDQRLIKVESDVRTGFAKTERKLNGVLKIITSIEEMLKEHKTLPAKVARLERSVFRS